MPPPTRARQRPQVAAPAIVTDDTDSWSSLAPLASDLANLSPTAQDQFAEIAELVLAHIADVLEKGSPAEREKLISKFGPLLFRRRDDDADSIDIEAAKREVKGWIARTGRSFFND